MVAANMGIDASVNVEIEGDLDLSGTLAVSREAKVGFKAIRLRFGIDAPAATEEELEQLHARSERYCTVLQTLLDPPPIESSLTRG